MPRIGTVIREVYRRPGAEELPAHVEQHYGIRVTGVTRLDAGVLRLERPDGPDWVARLFVSGRPRVRVEEDAEVLGWLEGQGFPAERAAHPEPVSSLDGRAVLVTEYLVGKQLENTPSTCRQLGELLGRMHSLPSPAGAARRPAGSLHHLPAFEGPPALDLAAAAALLADLEGRVPEDQRSVYETLLRLLPEGDAGHGLPESFLHPDPVLGNVVGTGAGPVLVDWTGAGQGPRLASLAVLLSSVRPRQVGDVLAGYRRHVTLTEEEIDRLAGVLWVRALWLASWQCWVAVVSGRARRTFLPDPARISATAEVVRVTLSGSP